MDRANLSKKIISILGDVTRLTNTLYALNMADIQRYPENYETLSIDAALRGEQIACRLRHVVYTVTNQSKNRYLEMAADAQDINIRQYDGIVEVTLPSLLTKRDKWKSMEFLLEPFTAAMNRYVREHDAPRYTHCVVCVTSVFDRALAERAVRDQDAIELKRYLDVITSFLLTDDNAILCDTHGTVRLGERDHTIITIMEKERFPIWLENSWQEDES